MVSRAVLDHLEQPRPATCLSFADRYTTADIIGNVTGAAQK
jgi:hypothetical protein